MRNMMWSGTAMVFLVAVGMFLGAQHAARYPNSQVGRWARSIVNIWEPMPGPENDMPPALAVAEVKNPKADSRLVARPEVIEPIVVGYTEEEPPLAVPRLSPEIVAAIERLRGEEESEAPPRIFDNPSQALHMPYADEESEVLPMPQSAPVIRDQDNDLSVSPGFLFLSPPFWRTIVEKVMDTVYQYGETFFGNDATQELEKPKSETPDALEQIFIPNYHENSCPYTGDYLSPFRYRLPVKVN